MSMRTSWHMESHQAMLSLQDLKQEQTFHVFSSGSNQRRAHMAERSYPRHHLLFVNKERQLGASAFHGSVVKFIGRWIQEHLYLGLKFIITYYGDTHLRHIQIKELKTDTTYRQKLLSIQDLDKKKKKHRIASTRLFLCFPLLLFFSC